MEIKYNDLEMAFDFVSADSPYGETVVYLCTQSGKFYYDFDCRDDFEEEPLPDDIGEISKYITIPHIQDLDLGKRLALKFADEYLPDNFETVYSMFHSKGAYSKFKALLERQDCLEKWYKYEQAATKEQLLVWCEQNDIEVNI